MTAYQDVAVGRLLDEEERTGTSIVEARKVCAKKSADFITETLNESAKSAFTCAAAIMQKNGIIVFGESSIRDDMFDRAAVAISKCLSQTHICNTSNSNEQKAMLVQL